MLRHDERVGAVERVRPAASGEEVIMEIDYLTEGGIRKTLKLRQEDARKLKVALAVHMSEAPADPSRG